LGDLGIDGIRYIKMDLEETGYEGSGQKSSGSGQEPL
jgi:hypothetical protein